MTRKRELILVLSNVAYRAIQCLMGSFFAGECFSRFKLEEIIKHGGHACDGGGHIISDEHVQVVFHGCSVTKTPCLSSLKDIAVEELKLRAECELADGSCRNIILSYRLASSLRLDLNEPVALAWWVQSFEQALLKSVMPRAISQFLAASAVLRMRKCMSKETDLCCARR